jgi:4a-hydroxytetrahydrobiopterin dehydratase
MADLLTQSQVQQSMQALLADPRNVWRLQDQSLHAQWKFQDFQHAFAFMTATAQTAQQMDHHPEWSNVYNRVSVRLTTHDAGGLTALDFALADAMTRISHSLTETMTSAQSGAPQALPSGLQRWVDAFNREDVAAMTDCYADDAVLWGTRSLAWTRGQVGIRGYFQTVFASNKQVRARVMSQQLNLFPGMQISTGIYQFEAVENGQPAVVDARFTFVWQASSESLTLVAHHSSLMP